MVTNVQPSETNDHLLRTVEQAMGLDACANRQYQRRCGQDGGACWCKERGLCVIPWDGDGPSPCTVDCERFEPRTEGDQT